MSCARDKAITGKDAREVDRSERGRTKQYLVYPLLSALAIQSGKEKRESGGGDDGSGPEENEWIFIAV